MKKLKYLLFTLLILAVGVIIYSLKIPAVNSEKSKSVQGIKGPWVPPASPNTAMGLKITSKAGDTNYLIDIGVARPRKIQTAPNILHFAMEGGGQYKLELMNIKFSLTESGKSDKILEFSAESGRSDEGFKNIRFKKVRITRQKDFSLPPYISLLQIRVEENSIRVERLQ